jgi:hypothetical protein
VSALVGRAVPVGLGVEGVHEPALDVIVSWNDAGSFTASHANGAVKESLLPLHGAEEPEYTSKVAVHEALAAAPHVHAAQPRVSAASAKKRWCLLYGPEGQSTSPWFATHTVGPKGDAVVGAQTDPAPQSDCEGATDEMHPRACVPHVMGGTDLVDWEGQVALETWDCGAAMYTPVTAAVHDVSAFSGVQVEGMRVSDAHVGVTQSASDLNVMVGAVHCTFAVPQVQPQIAWGACS